ncbi:MmpS family transport accessory protein [Paramicrobacterium chengjingii]|uniref:DUF4190 domain-containing protein n=1 Tax=Paramicrobacterium chengjingii TaxID=2769067 RepID=A0ABX6YI56_9MICO|nr:MmpS family transport accessory protein [Microbacterium chengjingii]QPZ38305.1 hypothetical protein HCR76_16200 [Microbacterium chengjingii]
MTIPPSVDPQFAPAQPQPPEQKTGNGLGVAALVVGIVAIVGAFIPFVNYASGFIAFVGLVLGIIALCLKGKRKGSAIAGTIISAVALILSIVMAMVYTAVFATAVSESIDKTIAEDEAKASQEIVVVYEVTGDAKDASVTYSTYNDGSAGTEQATGTTLPFTKEITVKAGGDFDWSSYSLIAMNGLGDTGEISCSITVDGEVVSEQTSSGELASATCSTSSFGDDDDDK